MRPAERARFEETGGGPDDQHRMQGGGVDLYLSGFRRGVVTADGLRISRRYQPGQTVASPRPANGPHSW